MEIVYSRLKANVAEVRSGLLDPPSYSAVRATMGILEKKGFLTHEEDGPQYVYRPRIPREKAARQAIRRFLSAYFDDSLENAVASLLSARRHRMKDSDYERLLEMIKKAREEGK